MSDDRTDDTPERRGCAPGAGTITPEHGGKIGNPPYVPNEEHRQMVKTYAVVLTQEQLAKHMGMSVDTLTKHYRKEFDQAVAMAVANVGSKLVKKAMAGHFGAMVFFLRTKGKWSQRVEVSGPNGGPITHVDLSPVLNNMTEEQLGLLEPLLEHLLAAGGVDVNGGDSVGAGAGEGDPAT